MTDTVSHAIRDETLNELCDRLADPARLAGGGVAAAASGASAAALTELVLRLSLRRRSNKPVAAAIQADIERLGQLREAFFDAGDDDVAAFVALMEAQRSARESQDRAPYLAALQRAANSPMNLARLAHEVIEIALRRLPNAAHFAASDLQAAGALSLGAIDAALLMVDVNLELMRAEGDALRGAAETLSKDRRQLAKSARMTARPLVSNEIDVSVSERQDA